MEEGKKEEEAMEEVAIDSTVNEETKE